MLLRSLPLSQFGGFVSSKDGKATVTTFYRIILKPSVISNMICHPQRVEKPQIVSLLFHHLSAS